MPWFKREHPALPKQTEKMHYVNVKNLDFSLMMNLKSILIYAK